MTIGDKKKCPPPLDPSKQIAYIAIRILDCYASIKIHEYLMNKNAQNINLSPE